MENDKEKLMDLAEEKLWDKIKNGKCEALIFMIKSKKDNVDGKQLPGQN